MSPDNSVEGTDAPISDTSIPTARPPGGMGHGHPALSGFNGRHGFSAVAPDNGHPVATAPRSSVTSRENVRQHSERVSEMQLTDLSGQREIYEQRTVIAACVAAGMAQLMCTMFPSITQSWFRSGRPSSTSRSPSLTGRPEDVESMFWTYSILGAFALGMFSFAAYNHTRAVELEREGPTILDEMSSPLNGEPEGPTAESHGDLNTGVDNSE
ncbi:hypothetical protein M231_00086 [Tremella mesenterica]|uniref:Uncharacterized protein n=1 Tax=Tremella mesenterica TaxID=5217 RepID=A0A4Q1BWQ1_TREME|nr:hypothetical protein M231_00086 [Tremella mesenterica]